MLLNFKLEHPGLYSDLLKDAGIGDFHSACEYVQRLPYRRISDKTDFSLVLTEKQGTCSSKHAVLAYVALEQHHPEVEIIAGIFLMGPETHKVLHDFFKGKPYSALPECHCYLRFNGERYDFTSVNSSMERIAPKIVREQRMDPHQAIEWKENIHKHYMESWLKRNLQLELTFEELWADRERCISLLGS